VLGSHEVVGFSMHRSWTLPDGSLYISQVVANLIATSHGTIFSWVGACPITPLSFKGHLSTRVHHTGTRNKTQENSPGNSWQQYTHGLLIHLCRNRAVVNSQTCYCTCGSHLCQICSHLLILFIYYYQFCQW